MNHDDMLHALAEVAEAKNIRVSYEPLGGETGGGGLCKVRGEYRIIIERRASAGERVAVLCRSLARFDLDDVFLAPEVRQRIAAGAGRSGRGRAAA